MKRSVKVRPVAENYLRMIEALCRQIEVKQLVKIMKGVERKVKRGRTIFVVGNGGSAATASHMACDLNKTVLGGSLSGALTRAKVICLSDNIPLLTALGNDCSYDVIFSEQLKNLGKKGDLLIVLTGSGNSKNIIEVVKTAKEKAMDSVAFLGFDGGQVKSMVDTFVLVPSHQYGPVEDFHLILSHLITDYLYQLNEKF